MKLITLNIWGGKIHGPLIEFIKEHKEEIDIFCFQEVFKSDRDVLVHDSRSNMLEELQEILPEFNSYFSSTNVGSDMKGPVDFPLYFGQATFTRKSLKVESEGNIFVHRKENDMGPDFAPGKRDFPRNFIYTEAEKDGKEFLILNIHGYWEPAPKFDTPQRFKQSEMFLDFISRYNMPKILAGDFNLAIDTQALKMLDEKLINLVKEYKESTTRSSLYDEKYRDFDKFADYIFVSEDVKVLDFKVLQDQVSDHLPVYLEFEI